MTYLYFTITIVFWFPLAPFLGQGLQPPNIPPQSITVPVAPGTNLQFQGPIQNPPPAPPPANDPGQSQFFRHYRR